MIQWKALDQPDKIDQLLDRSGQTPVLIFKHSPRCGLSAMVKDQFEKDWSSAQVDIPLYLLDVVRHRGVSQTVADRINIQHQSPQAIIVHQGTGVFDASHRSITADSIEEELKQCCIET